VQASPEYRARLKAMTPADLVTEFRLRVQRLLEARGYDRKMTGVSYANFTDAYHEMGDRGQTSEADRIFRTMQKEYREAMTQ